MPALQANPRPPANPPKQPRASYTDPTSGPEPSRTPIFRTLLAPELDLALPASDPYTEWIALSDEGGKLTVQVPAA